VIGNGIPETLEMLTQRRIEGPDVAGIELAPIGVGPVVPERVPRERTLEVLVPGQAEEPEDVPDPRTRIREDVLVPHPEPPAPGDRLPRAIEGVDQHLPFHPGQ